MGYFSGGNNKLQIFGSNAQEFPGYITTNQSGLVTSLANPWLAASPDKLVYDPKENSFQEIVEFKNPYFVRNDFLYEAAIAKKGFCLGLDKTTNKLSLKQNHDYFLSSTVYYALYLASLV